MRFSNLALLFVLVLTGFITLSAQADCAGPAIFDSRSCEGDAVSAKEMDLFNAVNAYRESNGLAPLRLSAPLSRLGNRRMLDLIQNMKTITHSWSNCRYDIKDESTWPCLTASPTRLNVGYTGEGYETLFRTTRPNAEPTAALDAWKKSDLHSSIILNKGMFGRMPWEEIGVAIDGSYASLWLGYRAAGAKIVEATPGSGLGVSVNKAIAETGIVVFKDSLMRASRRWYGESADRRIKIEITGENDDVASITVISTDSPANDKIFSKVLKNLYADQADIHLWLASSMKILGSNPKGWSRKIIDGRVAELHGEGNNVIRLTIKPHVKPKAVEME